MLFDTPILFKNWSESGFTPANRGVESRLEIARSNSGTTRSPSPSTPILGLRSAPASGSWQAGSSLRGSRKAQTASVGLTASRFMRLSHTELRRSKVHRPKTTHSHFNHPDASRCLAAVPQPGSLVSNPPDQLLAAGTFVSEHCDVPSQYVSWDQTAQGLTIGMYTYNQGPFEPARAGSCLRRASACWASRHQGPTVSARCRAACGVCRNRSALDVSAGVWR